MSLVMRVHGDGVDVLKAARHEITSIDPQQAIMQGGSLEQLVSDAQAKRRLHTTVLTAFAAVAVLLAALGIYGVTAHSVTRRRREIGTRLALGARPRDVVLMIARTGSRAIVVGAGWRGRRGRDVEDPRQPRVWHFRPGRDHVCSRRCPLDCVAGLALYLPSRRAAAVDPVVVLREA